MGALTRKVDDLAGLEAAWQRAEAFFTEAKDSYDLRLLTRGEQPFFLLEGLLESAGPRPGGLGDYFSVESAVYDGEITHLAVTDR